MFSSCQPRTVQVAVIVGALAIRVAVGVAVEEGAEAVFVAVAIAVDVAVWGESKSGR